MGKRMAIFPSARNVLAVYRSSRGNSAVDPIVLHQGPADRSRLGSQDPDRPAPRHQNVLQGPLPSDAWRNRRPDGARPRSLTVLGAAPSVRRPLSSRPRRQPMSHHFTQNPALYLSVAGERVLPPPAAALHRFGSGDKAVGDRLVFGFGVIQAEDQPA